MIVFKNNYDEVENEIDDDFNGPIEFQINGTTVTLTRNCPKIYNSIKKIINVHEKPEENKIEIPNLIQNKIDSKKCSISLFSNFSDDDERGYESYRTYNNHDSQCQYGEKDSVLKNNFDNREMTLNYTRSELRYFGISRNIYSYDYAEIEPRLNLSDDKMITKSKLPTPSHPRLFQKKIQMKKISCN